MQVDRRGNRSARSHLLIEKILLQAGQVSKSPENVIECMHRNEAEEEPMQLESLFQGRPDHSREVMESKDASR